MKPTKFGKGGITTAEGKATGREARVNARMSEMDKYLKDPTKKLIRTKSGKFQFVDIKSAGKSESKPIAKSARKATDSPNAVPGKNQKKPSIGGGSIPTVDTKAIGRAKAFVRKLEGNAVPGVGSGKKPSGGGSIPTPENKATRTAKAAVRKFEGNAVPGKRQKKPK